MLTYPVIGRPGFCNLRYCLALKKMLLRFLMLPEDSVVGHSCQPGPADAFPLEKCVKKIEKRIHKNPSHLDSLELQIPLE